MPESGTQRFRGDTIRLDKSERRFLLSVSEPVVPHLYCVFARPSRSAFGTGFNLLGLRLPGWCCGAPSRTPPAPWRSSRGRQPGGAFSKIEIACLQQDSASAFLPCAQQAWAIFAQQRATWGWLCAERRFIGRDGPFEQRLSLFGKLALLRIEPPESLKARRDVGMVSTECLLADCENPRLSSGSASASLPWSR